MKDTSVTSLKPFIPGRFLNAKDAASCGYDFIPLVDDEPTDTPAGSAARVEVYAARHDRGQRIFNDADSDIGYARKFDTRSLKGTIARILGDKLIETRKLYVDR